jgi:two-component system, sensor histidine kinase YesM
VRIPRLILQPLAENAVIHGVEPLDGREGQLEFEAFRTLENDRPMITLSVRDNGMGCDLGRLQEREHIGIGNVRKRFRYSFPGGAFNVKSAPGKGTEIRMTFNEVHNS